MPFEVGQGVSRLRVPEFDLSRQGVALLRLPAAGGGQGLAITSEDHSRDHALVSLERVPLLAPGDVPQADGAVAAGTGQGFSVRGKGQGEDGPGVSLEEGR